MISRLGEVHIGFDPEMHKQKCRGICSLFIAWSAQLILWKDYDLCIILTLPIDTGTTEAAPQGPIGNRELRRVGWNRMK